MTEHNEYGKALFMLAREEGLLDSIRDELDLANTVLSQNGDYLKILDTPAIPKEEKLGLIADAFASLSEYVKNTLMILCEKREVYTLPSVYSTFLSLYNEEMGIIEAECVTALPLGEKESEAIRSRLEKITGKTVILKNTVDPSILGGVKLRYLGIQVDGSLKARLDAISESIKNIVI